jgi:hypothetical protein
MTGPEKEIDIAALALTLFGEFSQLQEAVDGLAAFYTDRKAAHRIQIAIVAAIGAKRDPHGNLGERPTS